MARTIDPKKLNNRYYPAMGSDPLSAEEDGWPCKGCPDREFLARVFDVHLYGIDCPYVCKEYEEYAARRDAGGSAT